MNIRDQYLPQPWYPRDPEAVRKFLVPFENSGSGSRAAVSPHAGWYYSGRISARAVSSLDRGAETVVVIGGHLGAGSPFLFAEEEGVRTPFGVMPIDKELRDTLKNELDWKADRYQDNTIEVLLPMVHCFFPKSRLLWVRFPGDLSSYEAGKILARAALSLGRRIVVLGSTDLTHYGENYGFSPKGEGRAALDWVKNTNDAAFINAVLAGDPRELLLRADEDYSACSAGAVLGSLGFVHQAKGGKARVLEYVTSADMSDSGIPDSFVGYTAISWD